MKLLVEDGLTTAAGGIPHGGKLVGHGLAQSADLAVAATAAIPADAIEDRRMILPLDDERTRMGRRLGMWHRR